MISVALDSETALFRLGLRAPPITCVQVCDAITRKAEIVHVTEAHDVVEDLLGDPGYRIVGQFIAYDMACVCAEWPDLTERVFAAYEAGRVSCTKIRQRLADAARGILEGYRMPDGTPVKLGYSLGELAERLCKRQLNKDSEWRLRYGELRGTPVSFWPAAAREYALEDAVATLEVWEAQEKFRDLFAADEARQVRADFALHLISCRGFTTEVERVAAMRRATEGELAELRELVVREGVASVKKDGDLKRNLIAARVRIEKAFLGRGIPTPKTAPSKTHPRGQVKTDEETCDMSGDPALVAVARLGKLQTTLSKDVEHLERGMIQGEFNTILETGRTSCRGGFNMQNLPRAPGVRECFVPRPGMLLFAADFAALELCAFAQVQLDWFGKSVLADALNKGIHPHVLLAGRLHVPVLSYEEALARKRAGDPAIKHLYQTAKPVNFGLPGGMGPRGLVYYAHSQGVELTLPEATKLREQWMELWQAAPYFERIKKLCGDAGVAPVLVTPRSKRMRGLVDYTAACNHFFQSVGADAAKAGLWAATRACWLGEGPAAEARLLNFPHDEVIGEAPEEIAADAADEVARVMAAAAREFLPDVPPKVEVALMRRWSKAAEGIRDDAGRLRVWEPREKAA